LSKVSKKVRTDEETKKGLDNLYEQLKSTEFHVGYNATKSVLAAESQFGSSNLELTNSQSDAIDSISRSNLSKAFGFNQKRIDFLNTKFYGVINDYNKIYKIADWKGGEHSREVPYGLVKEEKSYLKIRNSNVYHAINIKLSLVKILDDDLDMPILYRKTFNKDYNIQDVGTVPCAYQISSRDLEANDFMNTILTYPSLNVTMSSNFKVQAKIVKTFFKMLNPGDTLDFRMIHHCGPGIRFDIAQSYLSNGQSKGTQPSSYGIIVEAFGTPCEGVRYKDDAVFQGTSPGYYNYEYKKQILAVKHSNLIGSVSDIKSTTIDKKYAIKIYEKVFLEQRPFHINVGNIGERGEENRTFGVLSTSAIKPVYSQNVIEGDKPGLYQDLYEDLYEDIKEVDIDLEDSEEDF
jgi:hypothetical protein